MKGAGLKNITAEQISFFSVSFRCPAAPEIGCGSFAKPVLLKLENSNAISEAWLNDTGTLIAVVGKKESTRDDRVKAMERVLKTSGMAEAELQGDARDKTLRDFLAGVHWLRGASVDQLSRREAGIIADRLMARLQAKQSEVPERIEALKMAISEYFEHRFTQESKVDQDQWRQDLMTIGRNHLKHEELTMFRDTLEPGYRPQPGEK